MPERNATCPDCGSSNVAVNGNAGFCRDCKRPFELARSAPDAGKAEAPMRIFLSYGHTEEEIVRRIKERLEARGHEVWYDASEIKAGDDWRERIAEGVTSSDGMLACISKHAFRDGGICRDEIDIAIGVRGGNIRTVLLDPEEDVELPSSISHIQWLDMALWREKLAEGEDAFKPWFEQCMKELIRVVESKESVQFQGDITTIKDNLTVAKDGSKQARLLSKPFYGREWITGEVITWLNDSSSPRICVLTGDVGVGKSAFAAHLSHWGWKLYGRVAASIFCEANRDLYNDPKVVIQTLAYLLACRIPQYRHLLIIALEKGLDLKAMDEGSLFTYLISEPFSHVIGKNDTGKEAMLVIIDGLDEAGTVERNPLAETLARYAWRLPSWMKILVTSRRIASATNPFGSGIIKLDLAGNTKANKADVRAFLKNVLFAGFGGEPDFAKAIDSVTEASDGIFLYAELMADAIKKGNLTLGKTPTEYPQGLPELFYRWFIWIFPDITEYRASFRSALGCIAIAPGGALPITELNILFGWDSNEINDFKRRMDPFLLNTTDFFGMPALAFNHAYIVQWLSSVDAGSFQSTPESAMNLMGRTFYSIAKNTPEDMTDYEAIYVLSLLDNAGMTAEANDLWNDGRTVSQSKIIAETLHGQNQFSRAIEILQMLINASDNHPAKQPFLRADILNSLSMLYDETGSHSAAEESILESLAILRQLEMNDPHARLAELSVALLNYGNHLQRVNRFSDAESIYCEALGYYRTLASEKPNHYRHGPALILDSLGVLYTTMGRLQDAEKCLFEALQINYELATSIPSYWEKVAHIALNLGSLNNAGGSPNTAEKYIKEAVSLYRKLAENSPATFNPNLSEAINRLGQVYHNTNRPSEALDAYKEALEMRRKLVESNPEAYQPALADTLVNIGNLLSDAGEVKMAGQAYQEALMIYGGLAVNDSSYMPRYATVLDNFGVLVLETGAYDLAEEDFRRALNIRRFLAKSEPEVYEPEVASSLLHLSHVLSETGRIQECMDALEESSDIYCRYAKVNPKIYEPYIADTQTDLGILLFKNGFAQQGKRALLNALNIRRNLAESNPQVFLPALAQALNNLTVVYRDGGNVIYAQQIWNVVQEISTIHDDSQIRTILQKIDRLTGII